MLKQKFPYLEDLFFDPNQKLKIQIFEIFQDGKKKELYIRNLFEKLLTITEKNKDNLKYLLPYQQRS